MKREAADTNHSVHSHEHIRPIYLKDSKRPSYSGLMLPSRDFVSLQGYPLGDVDRDSHPIAGTKWNWPDGNNTFRSRSNFEKRNLTGNKHRAWLEAETAGESFGNSGYPGWNDYAHSAKRDSAKSSISIHRNSARRSIWPFKTSELSPASIYSLKVIKEGKDALQGITKS